MSEALIRSGQLGLGYDPASERHDLLWQQSVQFAMRAAAAEQLQTFDPRPVIVRPSQFNMGSCDGHGGAVNAQFLNFLKTGQIVPMSRMWCYLQAQIQDGGMRGDTGASIQGFVAAAKTVGVCREETFPYPNPVQYGTHIPAGAAEEAHPHRICNSSVMGSYEDARHWLGMGIGGIQIGINWTQALANNRSGVIHASDCRGYSLGGHALAILGLSTDLDSRGYPYLWLVNSHGPEWGDQGCARVEAAAFDVWGQDNAALVGVSDMEQYQPRAIPVAWMV